jgi:oligoribonuclease (3'-5' exoribonuclease)
MKYISIDIETTSLVPDPKNILMVAMVLEDSDHPEVPVEELPKFACLVWRSEYTGQAFALQMNHELLLTLAKTGVNPRATPYPIYNGDEWTQEASAWLNEHFNINEKIVVAGKNVAGFDLQFFPKEFRALFFYRTIDPGSTFINWTKDSPPSLDNLLKLYNLGSVTHNAVQDAYDVIKVLRQSYKR